MEKEFNRNQRSYRPRRNDSRDDYQGRNEERPARFSDNNRGESAGRTDRPTFRSFDRREREDNRERRFDSPRPSYGGNNQREENFRPGRNRSEERAGSERKPLVKRGAHTEDNRREYKRPDFARKDNYDRPRREDGNRRFESNDRPRREDGNRRFESSDRPRREDGNRRFESNDRPRREDGNRRFESNDRPRREDGNHRFESSDRPRREDGNRRFESSDRPRREDGNRRFESNDRPRREDEGERREFRQAIPRFQKPISHEAKEELRQKHYSKKKILAHRLKNEDVNSDLRLNRFISMGGICSRRDADELIVTGRVKVNGEIVQTVGKKVNRNDNVEVDGVQVFPEKKVYIVLNKPKDFVTTMDDPLERKTVMSLIAGACKERVYPVGRLDRQTTGVLLFTNDGDLAKKLTHPKYDHKKIYHVFLDKALEEKDFNMISQGLELEDGFIKADEINYTSTDCTEVGIEIHSGKNRIVRRIFEHLGYQIVKLDRVYFAGITKKNVPRGKWRMLTSKEVSMLKIY